MARFSLSAPTFRELVWITFILAILCLVISGAQYYFVRNQLAQDDLYSLQEDAKNITASLHYTTGPDLAYISKAYEDAGPYMLINDDGTVININPSLIDNKIRLPGFLPRVRMPWNDSTTVSKTTHYTSPLGEQWLIVTMPMDGGYGVVGLSQYDDAKDKVGLLHSNAGVFPRKLVDFKKANADKIDTQVSWAVVDTQGQLISGDGQIPFQIDPVVLGSSFSSSGYRLGDSGDAYYVLYTPVNNNQGSPAAAIIGFYDVSQESETLGAMLRFSLGTGILSFLIFLGLFVASLFHHEKDKQIIRESFQKYFSPQILEAILSDPDRLKDQRTEISVMFSDIRSFTAMTEKLPPERLTKILQEYFDAMTEEVMATEGVVDKFIGDGIMAFWGAPIKQPDHADRAITTARRMIERLDQLKTRWKEEGTEGLEMGIGIHLGVATIGNMGSKKRSDYTAIGDVVNVASRLEGLNKKYNSHIIISESARRHLMKPLKTRDIGWVDLVGRDDKVHVHEVLLD